MDNKRIVDPLKGLPKKKAKRRDQWFTSLSDPDSVVGAQRDEEESTPYFNKGGILFRSDNNTAQQIPEPPPLDGPKADPLIKVLSYKKFDV